MEVETDFAQICSYAHPFSLDMPARVKADLWVTACKDVLFSACYSPLLCVVPFDSCTLLLHYCMSKRAWHEPVQKLGKQAAHCKSTQSTSRNTRNFARCCKNACSVHGLQPEAVDGLSVQPRWTLRGLGAYE